MNCNLLAQMDKLKFLKNMRNTTTIFYMLSILKFCYDSNPSMASWFHLGELDLGLFIWTDKLKGILKLYTVTSRESLNQDEKSDTGSSTWSCTSHQQSVWWVKTMMFVQSTATFTVCPIRPIHLHSHCVMLYVPHILSLSASSKTLTTLIASRWTDCLIVKTLQIHHFVLKSNRHYSCRIECVKGRGQNGGIELYNPQWEIGLVHTEMVLLLVSILKLHIT